MNFPKLIILGIALIWHHGCHAALKPFDGDAQFVAHLYADDFCTVKLTENQMARFRVYFETHPAAFVTVPHSPKARGKTPSHHLRDIIDGKSKSSKNSCHPPQSRSLICAFVKDILPPAAVIEEYTTDQLRDLATWAKELNEAGVFKDRKQPFGPAQLSLLALCSGRFYGWGKLFDNVAWHAEQDPTLGHALLRAGKDLSLEELSPSIEFLLKKDPADKYKKNLQDQTIYHLLLAHHRKQFGQLGSNDAQLYTKLLQASNPYPSEGTELHKLARSKDPEAKAKMEGLLKAGGSKKPEPVPQPCS